MFKKILTTKGYIFIGTLLTTGVIVVTGYNIINANSHKEASNVTQIQQVDYSKDIEALKERLEKAESKIDSLEEKITNLETENQDKEEIISNLQSKVDTLKSDTKSANNLKKQLEESQQKTKKVEEDLKQTKQKIQQRSKRLSEIQARLAETAKIEQDYKRIKREIDNLKKKEQTEEIISKIKELEIEYNIAKTVSDEVTSLNEEMRQLLFGEIEL